MRTVSWVEPATENVLKHRSEVGRWEGEAASADFHTWSITTCESMRSRPLTSTYIYICIYKKMFGWVHPVFLGYDPHSLQHTFFPQALTCFHTETKPHWGLMLATAHRKPIQSQTSSSSSFFFFPFSGGTGRKNEIHNLYLSTLALLKTALVYESVRGPIKEKAVSSWDLESVSVEQCLDPSGTLSFPVTKGD